MAETIQTLEELSTLKPPAAPQPPKYVQKLDKQGRAYATGKRKDAVARVWIKLGAGKIVMQTLRLPIASLVERGVDPNDIRSVAFLFDRRSSGTLYVGDIQVSN